MNKLPGMLSESEAELLKAAYLRAHETIIKEDVLREMAAMKAGVNNCMATLSYENAVAGIIYLQALNFLRYLINEPQQEPDMRMLACIPEYEQLVKHVAIYYPSAHDDPSNTILNLIDQILQLLKIRGYRTYKALRDVLNAILSNKVSLVVGLHLREDQNIGALLQKELDELHKEEKADDVHLPQCLDLPVRDDLYIKLLQAIVGVGVLRADTKPSKIDAPCVTSKRPDSFLAALAYIPKHKLHVRIVGDEEEKIQGILKLLQNWPGISAEFVPSNAVLAGLATELFHPHIFLLDEDMKVKGVTIHRELVKREYTGVIASISCGEKPAWANMQFKQKEHVNKDYEATKEFIQFVNILISLLLCKVE